MRGLRLWEATCDAGVTPPAQLEPTNPELTMRYTLWSRGRLVGHTDLDIHTVTSTMRQGFVEPTEDGRAILVDATRVWRAIAEMKRARRARGEGRDSDDHSLV